MHGSAPEPANQRQRGFLSLKLCVWLLIGFGLYTGYRLLPAYVTQSQLESAVANVLKHGSHSLTDEAIRTKALRAAESESVPLQANEIQIRRERRNGERTIHVEFQVPITVSYLGSERKLSRRVHVSRSYEVDEAALTRQAAQVRESRRLALDNNRKAKDAQDDFYRRIKKECQKSTRDFIVTHVTVTGPDGTPRVYGCSDTAYYPD